MNPSATSRKVTRVAVGVLERDDGFVLLADRPTGKPYSGYWEFPGGKIEPGEPVLAALQRELHEELGIEIGPSVPWVTFEFAYPHAYVRLHFHRIQRWHGEPHAREGQRLQFVHPSRDLPQPLLPAAVPALRWLRLPIRALVVSPRTPISAGVTEARDVLSINSGPRLVVIDADWRAEDRRTVVEAWRTGGLAGGDLLLASGPGAQNATAVDGVVLEMSDLTASGGLAGSAWRGLWADSFDGAQVAAHLGFDFVLSRSALPDNAPEEQAAVLPMFLRAATDPVSAACAAGVFSRGYWLDRRAPPG